MKKFISILLAVVTLSSVFALSACGDDETAKTSEATTAATATATQAPTATAEFETEEITETPDTTETVKPAETAKPTTAPASTDITVLAKGGQPAYAIYRDKWAEDLVVTGGAVLCDLIKDKTGVHFQYSTDDDAGKIKDMKEILIGDTNRAISDEAMKGLYENQFRFYCKDGSIAIVATNDNIIDLAVKKFAEEYVKDGAIVVPKDLNRTWQCEPKSSTTVTAQNPICKPGDDPFVTYRNGVYYYLFTASGATELKVATATSLDKISRDNAKSVYKAPAGTDHSKDLWAPEMYYLEGNWYIYVAADDGNDANHRMHVLKGTTQNPTDPFEYVGKISDESDIWAIDATVLEHENQLYFIWAGWRNNNESNSGQQQLYIAKMKNPTTLEGKRKLISTPQYSWERNINEGPNIVKRGGRTFLLFSAWGAWEPGYCVGYLELTGTNPMSKASWKKCETPLIEQSSIALAPGHNCVVSAPDGSLWMVYHAQPSPFEMWKDRNLWIQKLAFTADGDLKAIKSSTTIKLTVPDGWIVKNEIK